MEFPKIIHFIWINFKNELEQNPQIPDKYIEVIENTKRILHDYKVIVWDGYMCNQLLQSTFPEKMELYNSFDHPIQRCDFIRFVILYVYGGIYLDVDRYVLRSFNLLLEKYKDYDTILGKQILFTVNNDIFICKKNSQFMKLCIDNCKNKNYGIYFYDAMFSAGPNYITYLYHKQLYAQNNNKSNYKIIGLDAELNACNFCKCDNEKLKVCYSFTTFDNNWLSGRKFISFDILKESGCYLYNNMYVICAILIAFLIYYFLFSKKKYFKKNGFKEIKLNLK